MRHHCRLDKRGDEGHTDNKKIQFMHIYVKMWEDLKRISHNMNDHLLVDGYFNDEK